MNINALTPDIILVLTGLAILLFEGFLKPLRPLYWLLSIIALAGAAWAEFHGPTGSFFHGFIHASQATQGIDLILYAGAILVLLYAPGMLKRDGILRGEFYTLLLWGTVGMTWMVRGSDLLTILIGLELLSLSLYVLTALYRQTDVAPEAALKYFLMGAVASAFFLFGAAFYYGITGTTHLLMTNPTPAPIFTIITFFLLGVFAFKMALFPIHAWAPDVYQGSGSPVTTYLATLPKVAALVVFIRIFTLIQGNVTFEILTVVSVLTMFMGNLVAIAQRDVKRMLAYSGIAHMGYILIGIIAGGTESYRAIFFYAAIYIVMTMTAFAMVGALGPGEEERHTLRTMAGLGFSRPFYAFVLSVSLFSLTGLPPFAGFMAKFALFKAAFAAHPKLVFIAIINSILSIFYYIRVVYYLYMEKREDDTAVPTFREWRFTFGGFLGLLIIIGFGLFPHHLFILAERIAGTFLGGW